MRIGRVIPSYDFGNVLRPVALSDAGQNIPAVSGLLWTPIFVNASMIGVMLGYYNPANGVTVNFTPTKSFYVNVGVLRRQSRAWRPDRPQPADVQRLLVQHRRSGRQLPARRGQPSRAVRRRPVAADRHPVAQEHHRGRHRRLLPVRFTTCRLRASTRACRIRRSPSSISSAPTPPRRCR